MDISLVVLVLHDNITINSISKTIYSLWFDCNFYFNTLLGLQPHYTKNIEHKKQKIINYLPTVYKILLKNVSSYGSNLGGF